MNRKTILLIAAALVLMGGIFVVFFRPQNNLTTPQTQPGAVNIEPSKTLKAHADPSGFTFNYPDNLSIYSNELKDENTYAQLQLTAKGVEGMLSLKIADSKLKSVPGDKEVNLGNLKGKEVETEEKITLNALDSGVLFTVEIEFADKKDFWVSVYKSVISDFSFSSPQDSTASQTVDDSDSVSFEGEEVIE